MVDRRLAIKITCADEASAVLANMSDEVKATSQELVTELEAMAAAGKATRGYTEATVASSKAVRLGEGETRMLTSAVMRLGGVQRTAGSQTVRMIAQMQSLGRMIDKNTTSAFSCAAAIGGLAMAGAAAVILWGLYQRSQAATAAATEESGKRLVEIIAEYDSATQIVSEYARAVDEATAAEGEFAIYSVAANAGVEDLDAALVASTDSYEEYVRAVVAANTAMGDSSPVFAMWANLIPGLTFNYDAMSESLYGSAKAIGDYVDHGGRAVQITDEQIEAQIKASDAVIKRIAAENELSTTLAMSTVAAHRTVIQAAERHAENIASIVAASGAALGRMQENFNVTWSRRAEDLAASVGDLWRDHRADMQKEERDHNERMTAIAQRYEDRITDIAADAVRRREQLAIRLAQKIEDIQRSRDEKIAAAEAEAGVARETELERHERLIAQLELLGNQKAIDRENARHAATMAEIAKAEEAKRVQAEAEATKAEEEERIRQERRLEAIAQEEELRSAEAEKRRIADEEAEEKSHERRMEEMQAYADQQAGQMQTAFDLAYRRSQEDLARQQSQAAAAASSRLAAAELAEKRRLEAADLAARERQLAEYESWLAIQDIDSRQAYEMRANRAIQLGLMTAKDAEEQQRRLAIWQEEKLGWSSWASTHVTSTNRVTSSLARMREEMWSVVEAAQAVANLPGGEYGFVHGYQHGGVVPGRKGGAYPAVVHGGEMVLTPSQQGNLFTLLRGGQGGQAQPPVVIQQYFGANSVRSDQDVLDIANATTEALALRGVRSITA